MEILQIEWKGGKIEQGYKVFGRHLKSLQPCTSQALRSIRYHFDKWTIQIPENFGPFACFESLWDAQDFALKVKGKVLPVLFVKSNSKTLWKKNPPSFVRSYKGYGRGYYAESNGTTERYISECPPGTVLTKMVLPIQNGGSIMKKVKKNLNILSNGDNQLMYYRNGKFQNVPDQQFITTKNHRNFLIVCEYGDWSPFLTWEELIVRIQRLEDDYESSQKPDFFFRVVERL